MRDCSWRPSTLLNSPTGNPATRAVLIHFLALAWLLLAATSALAISAPIHIANTGGEGVFIRPEPNTSRPAVGWMPEGASPDYHCFVWGQNINGVPIWFNVTYNGVTGYYASYYDDSSYHSNEELTAKYGVPLCGQAPPAPAPTPPPASAASGDSRVFTIINAEEGIFYRNSASWGDTSRTPGVGVYNGDRVELVCGAFGDPVGPHSNKAWSKVRNLSRPSIGEGWVNEHFIDDGAPANGFVAGEPLCEVPSTSPNGSSGINSVFYSPNDVEGGIPELHVADRNIPLAGWFSKPCTFRGATKIPLGVHTLSGWSFGRLGPMAVLADLGWSPEIHRVVLFDPGSAGNMDPCDKGFHPAIGDLLAGWIASDSDNRLEIYTGHDSEEHELGYWGKPKFGGLWHYYFPRLWNQPFASQVRVCDYNNVGHEDILRGLFWVVEHPVSSCPGVPGWPNPVSWHP
jgi:hypothetical protein